MATLADLAPGDSAKITKLSDMAQHFRQIILSLGILPGTTVQLKRIAPMGDPLEICVRDTALSLRRQDAKSIQIDKVIEIAQPG